ncbi:threonine/serine exporter family protein [Clostridium sp.]|uniref:threonine/serine exporter family protein n=1 Tax=Clostridium sp. TaxID=1506 RepID=UPI002FC888C1
MYNDEIVHIAAEAGKIMLENGGETYRVEQTIAMICNAYNIKTTESFVTPTVVMISITNVMGETNTVIRRVTSRTVDLEKVAAINNLSRSLYSKPLLMKDLKDEVKNIENHQRYGDKISIIAAGITTAFFTLLFGGNIRDFTISFIAGILIKILSNFLNKLDVNSFFINVLGGALAAVIALVAGTFFTGFNVDKIIIGSIMLLVPGLAITNGIRDTISGDLLSGLSRSLEALMIAGAIAAGTGIVFKIWIYIFGGV